MPFIFSKLIKSKLLSIGISNKLIGFLLLIISSEIKLNFSSLPEKIKDFF